MLNILMTNYLYIILSFSCIENLVYSLLIMLWFYCSHFMHDGNGKFYTSCWIFQFHEMVYLSTLPWLDNILSVHDVLVLLAHLLSILFFLLPLEVAIILLLSPSHNKLSQQTWLQGPFVLSWKYKETL